MHSHSAVCVCKTLTKFDMGRIGQIQIQKNTHMQMLLFHIGHAVDIKYETERSRETQNRVQRLLRFVERWQWTRLRQQSGECYTLTWNSVTHQSVAKCYTKVLQQSVGKCYKKVLQQSVTKRYNKALQSGTTKCYKVLQSVTTKCYNKVGSVTL